MGAAYRRILAFFLTLCLLAGPAGLSVLASGVEMDGAFGDEENAAECGDQVNPASDPGQNGYAPEDNAHTDAAQNESPGLTEPALGRSGIAAAGTISAHTASTADELVALLEEDAGGVIAAACDLVIDAMSWDLFVEVCVDNPVTVDMGPYTLYINGNIELAGPVHITGTNKVVWLESTGSVLTTDHHVRISAVGDGAVAVTLVNNDLWADWDPDGDVTWDDWADYDDSRRAEFRSSFTRVEAEGAGAVAIDAVGGAELESLIVTAKGQDSVGIRSDEPLSLFLCAVEGEETAVSSGAGEIFLDSSPAAPLPLGASSITRSRVVAEDEKIIYTNWGMPPDAADLQTHWFDFYLPGTDAYMDCRVPVDWDTGGVDYDTPGEYPVAGTVKLEIVALFPMLDWPDSVPGLVVVMEGESIFLAGWMPGVDPWVDAKEGENYPIHLLLTLLSPLQEHDEVIVYYREEGAGEWLRVLDEYVSFTPYEIKVGGFYAVDNGGIPYQCQVEVMRSGVCLPSNILDFEFDDQSGGDRNNTDRDPDTDEQDGEAPGRPGGRGNGGRGRTEAPDTVAFSTGAVAGMGEAIEATTQETDGAPGPAAPADQPDATAQPAVQPLEQSLPRGTMLSYTARELADLADANPVRVTFIRDGMRLLIPTLALASMELEDGEMFLVDMGVGEGHQFHFRLYAGEREITAFAGATFTVLLPASFAADLEGGLLCSGEDVSGLPVERENNTITVHLEQTGSYRLHQDGTAAMAVSDPTASNAVGMDTPEPIEATGGAPVWPFAACGVLALGVGAWFLWRRRAAGIPS